MIKQLSFSIPLFFMLFSHVNAQEYKSDFLVRWEHSEAYLLSFAKMMPDSLYDFRPMENMYSFDQQLHHIVEHLRWITNDYLMGSEDPYQRAPYERLNANERLASVRSVFQDVREAIMALDDTDLQIKYAFRPAGYDLRTIDLLYLLLDHTTHHRGQLVVYLRLNNIQPPKYVGW